MIDIGEGNALRGILYFLSSSKLLLNYFRIFILPLVIVCEHFSAVCYPRLCKCLINLIPKSSHCHKLFAKMYAFHSYLLTLRKKC
jgi:hypothetical protein